MVLFAKDGPQAEDVIQSDNLGDCYFLSVLAAMAEKIPQKIMSMFEDVPSNIASDTLYTTKWLIAGKPTLVQVDTWFPMIAGEDVHLLHK